MFWLLCMQTRCRPRSVIWVAGVMAGLMAAGCEASSDELGESTDKAAPAWAVGAEHLGSLGLRMALSEPPSVPGSFWTLGGQQTGNVGAGWMALERGKRFTWACVRPRGATPEEPASLRFGLRYWNGKELVYLNPEAEQTVVLSEDKWYCRPGVIVQAGGWHVFAVENLGANKVIVSPYMPCADGPGACRLPCTDIGSECETTGASGTSETSKMAGATCGRSRGADKNAPAYCGYHGDIRNAVLDAPASSPLTPAPEKPASPENPAEEPTGSDLPVLQPSSGGMS